MGEWEIEKGELELRCLPEVEEDCGAFELGCEW
jgi:hypothetical protein